jgi:lipoprotein NlpD
MVLCGLAACSGQSRAPIEDRMAQPKYSDSAYSVKRGDTLYSIAFRYGLDYRKVAAANGIAAPYTIYPGQKINLDEAGLPGAGLPGATVRGKTRAPATTPVRPPSPIYTPAPSTVYTPASKPVYTPAPTTLDPTPEPIPIGTVSDAPSPGVDSVSAAPSPALDSVPVATSGGGSSAPVLSAPIPTTPSPVGAAPGAVGNTQVGAVAYTGDEVKSWRWPTSGQVIRGYSESVHKGIDIGGGRGDPIVAVAAGKVVYAGTGIVGFGELLIVKHNEIYLSAYGHNERLLVAEGQTVVAGQTIAEKGSSGTDTVKLHFEIRKEGKPIDPLRVLPQR